VQFLPASIAYLSNVFQLGIIFQEERKVLIGDIDVQVGAVLLLVLFRHLTARECMFVDLQENKEQRVWSEERAIKLNKKKKEENFLVKLFQSFRTRTELSFFTMNQ
jgi:hypothetical protein